MKNTRYICKTEEEVKIVCYYLKIENVDTWISTFNTLQKYSDHLSINHIYDNSFTQCISFYNKCSNNKKCSIINYDIVNANTLMREKN